jgi:hypothetical protein
MALRQVHISRTGEPDLARRYGSEEESPISLGGFGRVRYAGELDEGEPNDVGVALEFDRESALRLGFGGPAFADTLMLTRYELPSYPGIAQSSGSVGEPSGASTQLPLQQTSGAAKETSAGEPHNAYSFRRLDEKRWEARGTGALFDAALSLRGLELLTAVVLYPTAGSPVTFPRWLPAQLDDVLGGLSYLKPARKEASFAYPVADTERTEVGPSGEWTVQYLHRHAEREVTFWRPAKQPQHPQEARNQKDARGSWTRHTTTLADGVRRWAQHLDLAADIAVRREGDQLFVDTKIGDQPAGRPLADVGFGVGQALPLLVAGLSLPEGGRLIVEQPEAQLHPLPQAGLADFFCGLVKNDRAFLIETHSEAFFNRLRMRCLLDPELAEKVAVYFIDRPRHGCCAEPRLVPLGRNEEVRWPEGFLDEGIREELALSAALAVS